MKLATNILACASLVLASNCLYSVKFAENQRIVARTPVRVKVLGYGEKMTSQIVTGDSEGADSKVDFPAPVKLAYIGLDVTGTAEGRQNINFKKLALKTNSGTIQPKYIAHMQKQSLKFFPNGKAVDGEVEAKFVRDEKIGIHNRPTYVGSFGNRTIMVWFVLKDANAIPLALQAFGQTLSLKK